MADAPDWPKLLSLTVHEFRTPLTVVAGYLRMLSTDRVGPLTDAQKRVIAEAEKSAARLSTLLTEVSEIAHFHQGRLAFLRGPVDLSRVLSGITIPESADRQTEVSVGNGLDGACVNGDASRLSAALTSIAVATARESIDGGTLHVLPAIREAEAGRQAFLAVGAEPVARAILDTPISALPPFDSVRGGNGLSLVLARQILEDHGAHLFGAPGERPRSGAGIALPLSS